MVKKKLRSSAAGLLALIACTENAWSVMICTTSQSGAVACQMGDELPPCLVHQTGTVLSSVQVGICNGEKTALSLVVKDVKSQRPFTVEPERLTVVDVSPEGDIEGIIDSGGTIARYSLKRAHHYILKNQNGAWVIAE